MADNEYEFKQGFVDKRRNPKGQQTTSFTTFGTTTNYANVNNLRTRLTAISPTTYTVARLNAMTKNDMEYALRLSDDAGGIN